MRMTKVMLGLGGVALLVACGTPPKPVLPEANSGPDATWQKPQKLEIDPDTLEGEASDMVSFPQGDRSDWRRFKAPGDGELTFTLKVRPTKPGLDVNFKVLDETYHVLGTGKGDKGGRKKLTVTDVDASKYYVVVYAPDKMDAGSYSIKAKFKPIDKPVVGGGPAPAVEIVPMPSRLAAVPGADIKGRKPSKPRVPKEPKEPKEPTPVKEPKEPKDPPEDPSKKVTASIIDLRAGSSGTILTLNKGASSNLAVGAKGYIITRKGKSLSGGSVTLTTVNDGSSLGSTSASLDSIGDAPYVIFKDVGGEQ